MGGNNRRETAAPDLSCLRPQTTKSGALRATQLFKPNAELLSVEDPLETPIETRGRRNSDVVQLNEKERLNPYAWENRVTRVTIDRKNKGTYIAAKSNFLIVVFMLI